MDPWSRLSVREIGIALGGAKNVLDVGCGHSSPLQYLNIQGLVGIDGYEPSVTQARNKGTHSKLHLGDIRQLKSIFRPQEFEACVAIDVIEHLPKEEGYKLMEDMEAIASRKVVFFTPNGFLPQHNQERGDLQEHLSGWTPSDMRARGYTVYGMLGPKAWRGEFHRVIRQPRVFWSALALVVQTLHTRSNPESAAAILCVKDLGAGGRRPG